MADFKFGPIQEAWLKSLEEHPERQLRGALGKRISDTKYFACCLGEGGLICGSAYWKENILYSGDNHSHRVLADFEALGLYGACGETRENVGESLSRLNDNGTRWPEIAAIIRANPELYLQKSV